MSVFLLLPVSRGTEKSVKGRGDSLFRQLKAAGMHTDMQADGVWVVPFHLHTVGNRAYKTGFFSGDAFEKDAGRFP